MDSARVLKNSGSLSVCLLDISLSFSYQFVFSKDMQDCLANARLLFCHLPSPCQAFLKECFGMDMWWLQHHSCRRDANYGVSVNNRPEPRWPQHDRHHHSFLLLSLSLVEHFWWKTPQPSALDRLYHQNDKNLKGRNNWVSNWALINE